MFPRKLFIMAGLLAMASSGNELWADDDDRLRYEVRMTNLTRGQRFTPLIVVTHNSEFRLFEAGTQASPQLRTLAEEGDVAPMAVLLRGNRAVDEVVTTPPPPPLDRLLNPGATSTVRIEASGRNRFLSLAAMLIPTNDAFVALTGVELPRGNEVVTYHAVAYDAGTERNDELCASIPGPGFVECITPANPSGNGGGAQAGMGEGFIHVHNGMHGVGNMNRQMRDWRNPVAQITIRRVR